MAELKTKVNNASVTDFISTIADDKKRKDGFILLDLFETITGEKAKMWGTSIIGFGQYHYKSERSSQEGDWMLTGFSPRKQNLTLYVLSSFEHADEYLEKLGKHKRGMGCLYINKLEDVDMEILKKMIKKSYQEAKEKHLAA
jgi:hypothetical protein